MADVNLVSIIMRRGDQSNFVAYNIKHREFSNLVSVRKDLTQLCGIEKPAFTRDRVPPRKRRFGVRMFFRELVQALSRNDVHYGGATLAETFSDEKGEELYLGCSPRARPLNTPPKSRASPTGHVAHPSRSIADRGFVRNVRKRGE